MAAGVRVRTRGSPVEETCGFQEWGWQGLNRHLYCAIDKGRRKGDAEGRASWSLGLMGETIGPFPEACLARVQSGCHPPLINPSSASPAATVLLWDKPSLSLHLSPPSPQHPLTLLGRVRDTERESRKLFSSYLETASALRGWVSGATFSLGLRSPEAGSNSSWVPVAERRLLLQDWGCMVHY